MDPLFFLHCFLYYTHIIQTGSSSNISGLRMSGTQTRVLEFAVDAGGEEELTEQHFVHAEYHSNGRGFDMYVEGSENGNKVSVPNMINHHAIIFILHSSLLLHIYIQTCFHWISLSFFFLLFLLLFFWKI